MHGMGRAAAASASRQLEDGIERSSSAAAAAAAQASRASPAERLSAMVMSFSRRSTIHGLNHIAQARGARRRIFWMIICTAASCGFLVNLYHIAVKYMQVPVLTNVKHDHLAFKFPDITICNINPIFFPPKSTPQFDALVRKIEEYNSKIRKYNTEHTGKGEKNYFLAKLSKNIKVGDYLFMQRNISLYSIPQEIFVQKCKYMSTDDTNCMNSWLTVRRWPYGACYQLNIAKLGRNAISSANKKAFNSGFRPDLFLQLYKGVEYPDDYKYMDPHGTITMPSGVLLMLHEPGTFPQIGESFLLDKYAQVDLHMTRKQHLRKLKLCESYRETYNYIDIETGEQKHFLETRTDCVENITQTGYKLHCNCIDHHYPLKYDDASYPFCGDFDWFAQNFSGMKCLNLQKQYVERANPLKTCYKDMCEHTSYSTVISQANYPAVAERKTHIGWLALLKRMEHQELRKYKQTDLASKALLLNESTRHINITFASDNRLVHLLNIDFVERNFMYLRIVPSSLYADEMLEDEEYPLSRFLTDVGGCVGLWVGASLITVFEFCDLVLDFLGLDAIFRQRRRQQRLNGHTATGNLLQWKQQQQQQLHLLQQFNNISQQGSDCVCDNNTSTLLLSASEPEEETRNQSRTGNDTPLPPICAKSGLPQRPVQIGMVSSV